MNDALLNRLVDQGDGRAQQRLSLFAIARIDCGAKLLYLSAEPAPVAAVRFVAPVSLPRSFLR